MTMLRVLSATALLAAGTAPLPAQMEKRTGDRYDERAFAAAAPAVGQPAPDLCLFDLQGRPRSLALERGRTIVWIGGAFT